jgi:hypothetical protein
VYAPKVVKPRTKAAEGSATRLAAPKSTGAAAIGRYGQESRRGPAWNFGEIPLFPPERGSAPGGPAAVIQAKLTVGSVDDPAEREADAAADRVMRMADPGLSVSTAPDRISRKCAACREEDEAPTLRAKPARASGAVVGEAPCSVGETLRAPGQALDRATRGFFEPRFRRDFAGVRIHTGAKAAESAAAVNALAYASGEHIVLGAGQYAPHTENGRRLLAHELAHVVQQRPGVLARQPAPPASPPAPAPGGAPAPAGGPAPAPAPAPAPQDVIKNANTRRIDTLSRAIAELKEVRKAVELGLEPNPYNFTVAAIERWLHVNTAEKASAATIKKAEQLYLQNFTLSPKLVYQSNSVQVDPAGNDCPNDFAYSRGGVGPVYFCDNFLAKGPNCQRDVMIHEHFHLLGMAKEFYGAATTELALKSPDSLSQLAAEIMDGPHKASCLGTD